MKLQIKEDKISRINNELILNIYEMIADKLCVNCINNATCNPDECELDDTEIGQDTTEFIEKMVNKFVERIENKTINEQADEVDKVIKEFEK